MSTKAALEILGFGPCYHSECQHLQWLRWCSSSGFRDSVEADTKHLLERFEFPPLDQIVVGLQIGGAVCHRHVSGMSYSFIFGTLLVCHTRTLVGDVSRTSTFHRRKGEYFIQQHG